MIDIYDYTTVVAQYKVVFEKSFSANEEELKFQRPHERKRFWKFQTSESSFLGFTSFVPPKNLSNNFDLDVIYSWWGL